ncbi:MAG: AbgT family transporter, partial [Alistipes sp.]|nr:AbgT family transporter [Candidatus Minthomonas equi]
MTRKREFPNTYVIIAAVLLLCAAATCIVPGATPQTWQIFSALYDGFVKQAGVIIFILVIGGTFQLINSSRAVDAGIIAFLKWTNDAEKNPLVKKLGVNNIVTSLTMLIFSLFGGVFGMSEETIPFVALVIPLAISMGYDSITGVCMVYVAAHVGFAGAFLNPFTIGVAQGMAEVPLFSGIGYRFICWAILTLLTIAAVLVYASRIRKHPERSLMYEADAFWRNRTSTDEPTTESGRSRSAFISFILCLAAMALFSVFYSQECFLHLAGEMKPVPWLLWSISALFALSGFATTRRSLHFYILNLLGFTIIWLIIGVLCFEWYLPEISALFLGLGIACGIAAGKSPNALAGEFMTGMKDILSSALIVGFASGIVILLQNGHIIEPLLSSMASSMNGTGHSACLTFMYGIQTVINLFIPSATAKAAITIPIMAPFSDLIGVSRQSMILAFQFGDGFTNMITPTSGVLMAV